MNKGKTVFFCVLLVFCCMLVTACGDMSSGGKMKIAVGRFSHETCTFAPNPTTIEDWEYYGPPSADILNTTRGYIGGFVDFCNTWGDVELVGLTSPGRSRGGSSGSWLTAESFDKYTGLFQEDLRKIGKVDGVFLALHGAMAVTGTMKPEAEIVRRVREVVGPDVPIMVSLDLHANEDHELSDAADAVFIIKRYPHYDTKLIGENAARVMMRTLKGDYKPVMATRKPGVITPSVFQGTGVSPAKDIMERARRWERQREDVFVSVAFGFAYADVPDVGATVMVVTNNDQELADEIADDMNDYIWRNREAFAGKRLPKTREGVRLALDAVRQGKTPVVIADHSDRTGGSTHILEELIRQGGKNFCIATLRDEKAVAKITADHQVGDNITISLGGYSDEFAGNPIEVRGTVDFIGEYRGDKIVSLNIGNNNHVILTPNLMQITDTNIYSVLNIDFTSLDLVSLKTRVHFRRGYHETGIAGSIFEIDAPGLGPADLTLLPYQNIPDGLYPIVR